MSTRTCVCSRCSPVIVIAILDYFYEQHRVLLFSFIVLFNILRICFVSRSAHARFSKVLTTILVKIDAQNLLLHRLLHRRKVVIMIIKWQTKTKKKKKKSTTPNDDHREEEPKTNSASSALKHLNLELTVLKSLRSGYGKSQRKCSRQKRYRTTTEIRIHQCRR